MWETRVRSLGREDLLEEMAIHPSTIAWKIPWTEEPGRLQSVGSQRVWQTERVHFHFHFHLAFCVKKSKSPTQALGWAVTWVGDGKEEILWWRDTESFWDIVVSSLSCVPTLLRPHGLQPTRLFCPWNFPGKDTGVSCHFILQGIFPTQGSNPHLLHGQANSLQPSHQGSPSEILAIFYFNPKGGYYMNSHLIILL